MQFTINHKPLGKARPRVTRTHTYTPKATKDYENFIKLCYNGKIHDKALCVRIIAFMPIPKSYSKKDKALCLEGAMRPLTKPDSDNIAKAILDALNGVAYTDDSLIVDLHVSKFYVDGTGHSIVEIKEI